MAELKTCELPKCDETFPVNGKKRFCCNAHKARNEKIERMGLPFLMEKFGMDFEKIAEEMVRDGLLEPLAVAEDTPKQLQAVG
jgi:hypothetical protein